jgi:hypothetical protein
MSPRRRWHVRPERRGCSIPSRKCRSGAARTRTQNIATDGRQGDPIDGSRQTPVAAKQALEGEPNRYRPPKRSGSPAAFSGA